MRFDVMLHVFTVGVLAMQTHRVGLGHVPSIRNDLLEFPLSSVPLVRANIADILSLGARASVGSFIMASCREDAGGMWAHRARDGTEVVVEVGWVKR